MATTWKLNNNLMLLSSKRTHNLRGSLCRLQFGGANSYVSGFKVESLRLNSTSSSRINNNVPLSDEVESFSLNKKNATHPFEVALNVLKSKVPSLVMASCLMLGMMMINCHKPAFARTPFSSSSPAAAASASSSSARGCPLCLNGCVFCLKLPASSHTSAKESPYRHSAKESALMFLVDIFCFLILAAVGGLTLDAITANSFSILKIQVGLLVTKDLQRDLNLITTTLEKCTSSAWNTIVEDVIEVLNWHRNNWKFGYSHVTLLVAFRRWHKLPTIRKRGDLDQVLKKLKSYISKTNRSLEGIDVLCVPEKGNDIMSLQQLKENYPLLKPI